MAEPKKKKSKARTGTRRSQWKVSAPGLSVCTNCKSLIVPHRVCPSCGYYKRKEIIATETA